MTFHDLRWPSPVVVEQPVGFVYYDGGKIRFNNSPLQTYLEDRMMVGSLIGLDDTWQAGGMPHSVGHLGQIMHVREMVETQDWEPIILPPAGAMGAGHKAILRQLHLQAPQAEAATAVFPENQKQSCLGFAATVSVRSTYTTYCTVLYRVRIQYCREYSTVRRKGQNKQAKQNKNLYSCTE